MKKITLLSFLFFWTLTPVFSQSESVIAYHHKAKDVNYILLLECNIGYYYSGPHIPIDEVFTYEVKGDKIIRNFDSEYSIRQRVDTLIINKKSVKDVNGLSFKKVSSRKREKLIKRYIHPTPGIGFFEVFLKRTKACKNKKS